MKIAVVSKADASGGGASRVAEELTHHLLQSGHQAVHFATWASSFNGQRRSLYGRKLVQKATLVAHKIARKLGFGELIPFEAVSALSKLEDFDLVHFHDTSSAVSPLTLYLASLRKPVVWTFHDCSPFTGGCIYPQMAGCERYKDGCGGCPMKHEWPIDGLLDMTSVSLKLRRRLHARPNVFPVAPSAWMKELAWASGNLTQEPTVISNMVDTAVLRPFDDRAALRRRLGIAGDRLVLAASSGNIDDTRKGIADTLRAAAGAREANPVVILLGGADKRLHQHVDGIEFISTGYVRDRAELREWLSAADAFVFTSKADNQPLSILESFACGTPVYGWPTGGAAEMIHDGVLGRTVPARNVGRLSAVILEDWLSGKMTSMRHSCRNEATTSYGAESFVSSHIALYERALTKQA